MPERNGARAPQHAPSEPNNIAHALPPAPRPAEPVLVPAAQDESPKEPTAGTEDPQDLRERPTTGEKREERKPRKASRSNSSEGEPADKAAEAVEEAKALVSKALAG